MDDWLESRPECFRRIVIPGGQTGVSGQAGSIERDHRTLFPGMDGPATWLQEHHEPTEDLHA